MPTDSSTPVLGRRRLLASAGSLAFAAGLPARADSGPADAMADRLAACVNIAHWWRWPPSREARALETYLSDAELAQLRSVGITGLRIPVEPEQVTDTSGNPRPDRIASLRIALDRIAASGLAAVLDLHPRSASWVEDPTGPTRIRLLWSELAQAMAPTDPGAVAFELLNEPVFRGREADWHALQAELTANVRGIAPHHTLIASGCDWSSVAGLTRLPPLADRNVIYNFHFYVPMVFTHQGASWGSPTIRQMGGLRWPSGDPATCRDALLPSPDPTATAWSQYYCREGWDAAHLARMVEPAAQWAAVNDARLFAGEFGANCTSISPASRLAWFADARRTLEAARVGWSVWGADTCMGFGSRAASGLVFDPPLLAALGLRSPPP